MAVTIEPELEADVWNLAEWQELILDRRPGTSTHSYQQQTATETIVVPTNKVRSAITKLLGYSIADSDPASATAYKLLRPEVPCRHPWYRHLWADAVQVQELQPIGGEDVPGSGNYVTDKPADPDATLWFYAPSFTVNNPTSLLTVTFRSIPWKVWRDDDPDWQDNYLGEEWRRMVANVSSTPQLDLLTADGTSEFTLYYAEKNTALPTTPNSPTIPDDRFPGTIQFRKVQNLYEVCWRGVEEQYLTGQYPADIDDGIILPYYRRLDRFLGCTNRTPFLGHKRGTLLFDGYKPVRFSFPGVRTNTSFGLMGVDVYLYFKKFDPPTPENTTASDGTPVGVSSRLYGHQLVPFRPNPDRYWFAATAGSAATRGTFSGSYICEEVEFEELFRHLDDPAYPLP